MNTCHCGNVGQSGKDWGGGLAVAAWYAGSHVSQGLGLSQPSFLVFLPAGPARLGSWRVFRAAAAVAGASGPAGAVDSAPGSRL